MRFSDITNQKLTKTMKHDITKIVEVIEEANKEITALIGDEYQLPDELRQGMRQLFLKSKSGGADQSQKQRLFDALYGKANGGSSDYNMEIIEFAKNAQKFSEAAVKLSGLFQSLFETLKPTDQAHGQ